MLGRERTEQADFDKADLLTVGVEIVDDFFGHVADRAHGDDDAVSVRCAVVVEQLIVGAQLFIDLVHVLFNNSGQSIIKLVAGFAVLEENIAVFVAAAHGGVLRIERAACGRPATASMSHMSFRSSKSQTAIFCSSWLVRKPSKKLRKGTLPLTERPGERQELRSMTSCTLPSHSMAKPVWRQAHDVGVVAEDVEGVGRNSTRRNVEDGGQLLSGNLVHVGNHEQQALRGGIGGRHGACCAASRERRRPRRPRTASRRP